MKVRDVLVILLIATTTGSSLAEEDPIVETSHGKVRGYRATSRSGRPYLAFSGLPFAKPPLGQLRFEPPQPAEKWSGIRNATEDGPWCTQYNMFELNPTAMGVEDCLYLSVYTHSLSGRRPVIMHIHGGGYTSSTGPRLTGPQYFMDQDIVIVNINYRLDVFGFLSFEDSVMPGNQGMKDQVMALKWIKSNIANFGGDPNRVTIVGESAGAGSVYHHTVSPLSKGLFHGGIAESGSGYNNWAVRVPGTAKNGSITLLSLLGCNYTTTQAALVCLRSKDAYEIATTTEYFRAWLIDKTFVFGPVLEPPSPGAFLTGPISKWKHNPVPLIIGTTAAEGLLVTNAIDYYNISYKWYDDNFEKIGPITLVVATASSEPDQVVRSVKNYYFPNGEITEKDWVNLTTMYSDSWFTIGIIDGANKHNGDVYFYLFDYLSKWGSGGVPRNYTKYFGATHTEEILYLWKFENANDLTGEDLEMSKSLVKVWVDFATHGCPTTPRSKFQWKKWSPRKHITMKIDNNGFNMIEGFAKDRYRFWKTLKYNDNYEIEFYKHKQLY